MDVSETYIEMCEKAEEIQELSPWQHDDGHNFWHVFETLPKNNVWLPRQDQLQEMLGLPMPELLDKLYTEIWTEDHGIMIPDWAEVRDKRNRSTGKWLVYSWEQLWLAFVMKENNKVWDGTDWIFKNGERG